MSERVGEAVVREIAVLNEALDNAEAEIRRLREEGDALAGAVERRWSGPGGCDCECCTAARAWRAIRG